jgi:hypothetical protein
VNINLHIDRLILEGLGVEPGQKRILQTAVQTELAQLFAASGVSPALSQGGAIRETAGPTIQLMDQNNPGHIGSQIARSVHQGIVGDTEVKR